MGWSDADIFFSAQDSSNLDLLASKLKSKPMLGLCGAGISVPLGFPTWRDLIIELLEWAEQTGALQPEASLRLAARAGNPNLATVASYIKRHIPEDSYTEFIHNVFSPRCTVDFSVEHEILARLPIRLWMTTNYDVCLCEALRAVLDRNVNTRCDIPFDKLLEDRATMPEIVHLHGSVRNPGSIVFTEEDYDRLYYHSQRLSHQMTALAAFSVLFVGYGFVDEEFNQGFKTTHAVLGSKAADHFALLPIDPTDPETSNEMRQLKAENLKRKGIRAIFYKAPAQDHSRRLGALEQLTKKVGLPGFTPRHELKITWVEEMVTSQRLREQLRRLTATDPSLSVRLLKCAASRREVVLESRSEAELQRLRTLIESSDFWHVASAHILSGRPDLDHEVEIPVLRTKEGRPFGYSDEKVVNRYEVISRIDLQSQTKKDDSEAGDLEDLPGERRHRVAHTQSLKEYYRMTLHATALGMLDPSARATRYAHKSLAPRPLPFCLSDCFHPEIDWRLDSPIVHVWFFTDNLAKSSPSDQIYGFTAIGRGLPEIREKIETAAFNLALFVKESSIQGYNVIINSGLIHFSILNTGELDQEAGPIRRIIASLVGTSKKGRSAPPIPDNTKEALRTMRSILIGLAEDTGFVVVHTATRQQLEKFHHDLFPLRHGNRRRQLTIREPSRQGRVVECVPIPHSKDNKINPVLGLKLSGDLMKAPEFVQVLDAYHRDIITRMRADLERRLEFWRDELDKDTSQVHWFKSLSPEEQLKLPDVIADVQILEDLAIQIAVIPTRVSAKVYYGHNVPEVHIPRAQRELVKLEALNEPIVRILKEPHSFIWHRAVARMFDCAIRRVPFSDDTKVQEIFDEWREQVDAFLSVEWERYLDELGIDIEDIFRRTVVFDITYDETTNLLEIYPRAVVDSARTVIFWEPGRNSLSYTDPIDTAELEPAVNLPEKSAEDLQLAIASVSNNPGGAIRSAAFENLAAADRILCALQLGDQEANAVFEGELEQILVRRMTSAAASRRFFRLANQMLFHSAFESLEPDNENNLPPGKALAIAYAQCLKSRVDDPIQTLKDLRDHRNRKVPAAIRNQFFYALETDKRMVESFLDFSRIPIDDLRLDAAEQVIASIVKCKEFLKLAEKFGAAANSLNPEGESLLSVFLKTDAAFEAAYCGLPDVLRTVVRIRKLLGGEPVGSSSLD